MVSKTKLKQYSRTVYQLMRQHKGEGSFATHQNRTERLVEVGRELQALGFKLPSIASIKPKHVEALVANWQDKHLSVGTIKNRLSDIRYTCKMLNRPNVIHDSNAAYGIGARQPSSESHNRALHSASFDHIDDPYLRCSLELQRLFGLRREECVKCMPHQADQGNLLVLQGSWTKGGIPRSLPIQTTEQRKWLEQAKGLVKKHQSLIPPDRSYIQQRTAYDSVVKRRLKIKNLHGLRHAYAQRRYQQITQREPPIVNPKQPPMTPAEKQLDREARTKIAKELGHQRPEIAKAYLD